MNRVLAGRYILGPVLGAGGMGRVYAAHDRVLDRPVAVKVPGQDLDAPLRERLLREARTAARFQHPNAVAVYDVGQEDGQPFVVMELVDGETLAARLRREGALPVHTAVAILEALLHGLEAAHGAGLVHRDVKPANVLLPGDGPPKLADFGIAKQMWDPSTSLTMTGAVVGTPAYLAPEQAAGKEPTPASDLYSAGVVAYEMLTGAPPYSGPTPLAVALAHQRDPLPPLRETAPHVPPGVAAAVERALAKDPDERFRSAAEMRTALHAPATSPRTDSRRASPAMLAVAAVAVVLVGFLGAVLPWSGDDEPSRAEGPAPAETESPAQDDGAVAAGAMPDSQEDLEDEAEAEAENEWAEEADPEGPDPERQSETGNDGGPNNEGPAEPTSLQELAALIADDPAAAGARSDDLLDELLEVAREDAPEDRRVDARELIVDIGEWQAEGDLALDVAWMAVELLEPVGRPEAEALEPVSAAFASLATRPGGAGEKYVDVLESLEELLGMERRRSRAREADRLLERLEEWTDKEELDGDVEPSLREVLTPLVNGRRG